MPRKLYFGLKIYFSGFQRERERLLQSFNIQKTTLKMYICVEVYSFTFILLQITIAQQKWEEKNI